MSQSKLGSLAESAANIAIGFTINFFANMVLLPLVGITQLTVGNNLQLGCAFTVISLARSYVLRRWFNRE